MGEVVDFEAFEGTKENLQPLKKGRNLAALKSLIDKEPKGTDEELELQRCAHEEKIKSYVGDDPLVPWLDFITWTQQAYSSGGVKSMLIQLLEKCTKEFQHDERYRNSDKYLRVWIIYADNLREPEDVFSFLQNNEIGQKRSLFYEAYALVLESRGKAAHALEILERGVNMQAEPTARIKAAFKNAQARTVRRTEQMLQAQNDPFGMPSKHEERHEDALSDRQVLSRINKKRTVLPSQPASNTLQLTKQPQKNARFEVFCDDEAGEKAENPVAIWDDLHSQANKEKENTGSVTTWNSSALPSQAKHAKRPHAKPVAEFDVFVDEDCASFEEDTPIAPNTRIMALRAIDVIQQKRELASVMDARLAVNMEDDAKLTITTSSSSSSSSSFPDEQDTPMLEAPSPSPAIVAPLIAPASSPFVTSSLIDPSPLVASLAPSPFAAPLLPSSGASLAPSPLIAPSALIPSPLLASALLPSPIVPQETKEDMNSLLLPSPLPLASSAQPAVVPPKPKRALVFEDEEPSFTLPSTTTEAKRASAPSKPVIATSRPSSSSVTTSVRSAAPATNATIKVGAAKPAAKKAPASFTVFCDEPEPSKPKKRDSSLDDLLDFGGLLD